MTNQPTAKKLPLKNILFFALFALAGMGLGYYMGAAIKHMPSLASRLDALVWWDLLLLPIGFLFVLAVHEAGHLLGGFRRGMRFLLYIVGPFQFSKTASGIRFNWQFNMGTFGGLAAATPDPNKPIRPQLLSLIAGGPLASLVLAFIGFAVFMAVDNRLSMHAAFIALMSLFIFVVTAIPSRAGGFMSDGMQFIEVLRGGDAVIERQQLTALMAQSMAGTRPRDWDADWLQAAANKGLDDPLRSVALRQMAFIMSEDSGDAATADTHAHWLAEHLNDYPMGFRQSLTIELCLHAQARGNPDSARAWLAQSKGGVVDKARRALAEAELAFADGQRDVAQARCNDAFGQIKNGMDAGITAITNERLLQLHARLRGE